MDNSPRENHATARGHGAQGFTQYAGIGRPADKLGRTARFPRPVEEIGAVSSLSEAASSSASSSPPYLKAAGSMRLIHRRAGNIPFMLACDKAATLQSIRAARA